MTDPVDDLDAYIADAMQNPAFARAYEHAVHTQNRMTAVAVFRRRAWFRIRGRGLWVGWGSRERDLFTPRKTAHYWGPLRWKILRRESTANCDKRS